MGSDLEPSLDIPLSQMNPEWDSDDQTDDGAGKDHADEDTNVISPFLEKVHPEALNDEETAKEECERS